MGLIAATRGIFVRSNCGPAPPLDVTLGSQLNTPGPGFSHVSSEDIMGPFSWGFLVKYLAQRLAHRTYVENVRTGKTKHWNIRFFFGC